MPKARCAWIHQLATPTLISNSTDQMVNTPATPTAITLLNFHRRHTQVLDREPHPSAFAEPTRPATEPVCCRRSEPTTHHRQPLVPSSSHYSFARSPHLPLGFHLRESPLRLSHPFFYNGSRPRQQHCLAATASPALGNSSSHDLHAYDSDDPHSGYNPYRQPLHISTK